MFRKILLLFVSLNIILMWLISEANASRECTNLGPTDTNTFKEYCYKITDAYLSLRNKYKVDWEIDAYLVGRILNYWRQWLNFLPDDLQNKNYYTHLQTAIERWLKDTKNSANFDSIATAIDNFLNKTIIQEINWNVEVFPSSGNAPLTVTFRGNVTDPTWAELKTYNYTWWIQDWSKRKIIWNNNFLNYTFREEWTFSVFLDVTSNHKNWNWKTDVLPFSKKIEVTVKEKIASMILKVNSKNLDENDELKFSPDDSIYGLLFDATSSIPTSGTKFLRTEWDFWNGIVRKYDSAPKVERITYANEGDYKVILKLKTNAWKELERRFNLVIRNPIATINASDTEWYIWDKFTFTANSYSKNENYSYRWEVIDLQKDKVLFSKNLSTFVYSFTEKWRYNVRLVVTSPSWERDYDNKIIYINSRPPFASFISTIPHLNKPNTVFLDASTSYDLDLSDDGKLEYSWIINWERVNLDNANANWSNGYYTFSTIWEQSVVLEVTDPDDLSTQKSQKISISSVLSVDLNAFPRVSQVWGLMKFIADSPNAKFYEWDFGDGETRAWVDDNVTHSYKRAGTYTVRLTVRDDNNVKNSIEKVIYVSDSNEPFAVIKVWWMNSSEWAYPFIKDSCNWNWAYIVNKVDSVNLSWLESIDVTGLTGNLTYSWKIWDKYYSSSDITRRFDDIWCIPVKLTVKSLKNGREATAETYLKVENLKPTLAGLDISVKDTNSDPVIVDVKALWAMDRDGVIQSYLWYYYTDLSTEPQDFRATKTGQTTFVLPKITWTYYFVLVLKDNNEERLSSQDLNSKYYITLTWDNVNTPLVGISANNTSVKALDEVVFTANVTNILGQNLNNEASYSWDFDWDGFYDTETKKNIISHKFTKAWEYRVKLKVKNKWYSNTKTITINVSNILNPDFEAISIWNEVLIFDKSSGSIDSYTWEMWDGKKLDKKWSFIYSYDDGSSVHLIKLKVSDSSNTKEITKKVVRDFGRMISTKKEALSIFSNYPISWDKITLKEEVSDLQLFLKTNLSSVKNFAVDFNVATDSDLNGWKDDDEDNKNELSYTTGWPVNIELNNSRVQKIKIFLKDESGKVLETKELTIEKEYIAIEESVNKDSIKLDWVSDSIKNIFENIKAEVEKLDVENKTKSLSYLQKLQEEWSDARERTNIIMEFSSFISEIKASNSDEIVSLLEWLLVEENEKADEYRIVLNALKNLIPKNIVCSENLQKEVDSKKVTCYDLLTSKLETIYWNNNIAENKVLGKEILEVISADKTMTNSQKVDFKALLQKLINKDKAPEEGELPKEDNNSNDNNSWLWISGILMYIVYAFFVIVWIWLIWFVIYFISYKLKWEKENSSFSDYIAEQTDNIQEKEDILWEVEEEKKDNFDPLSPENNVINSNSWSVPDWLKWVENTTKSESFSEKSSNTKEEKTEKFVTEESKQEENISPENTWEIPSWLLGGQKDPEKKQEEKIEDNDFFEEKTETITQVAENKSEENFSEVGNNLTQEDSIPDWLKPAETEETKNFEQDILSENNISKNKEIASDEVKEEFVEENFSEEEDKNEIVNNSDYSEIPDWLKPAETTETIEEVSEEPKLETEEELNKFTEIRDEDIPDNTKKEEDNLPDWLKWDFSSAVTENKTENIEEKKSEDLSFDTVSQEKEETKPKPKKTRKPKKQTQSEALRQEQKSKAKDEELWDDGMKIPDWLKSDSDK